MIYTVSVSKRRALQCDRCGGRYHPRTPAASDEDLRARAARQGWQTTADLDFCTVRCAQAAAGAVRVVVAQLEGEGPGAVQAAGALLRAALGRET